MNCGSKFANVIGVAGLLQRQANLTGSYNKCFSAVFPLSPQIKSLQYSNERLVKCKYSSQMQQHPGTPNKFADKYQQLFEASQHSPSTFWAEQASKLTWHKPWTEVLDFSNPPFAKWFVGGEISTCYNAVDRHVEGGRGDQVAIVYDSPVTDTVQKITYSQLQQQVSKFAGVLTAHGVAKGDVVLIYMPMIPEAMVTMLACTRVGAVHSLVFGGFASKELSTRINHAKPKVVVSANCGKEPGRVVKYKPLLDEAIRLSEFKPKACIIYNRTSDEMFEPCTMVPGRDFCFSEEQDKAKPVDCVPIPATDPVYILYTSGTTGTPKAVVRPNGGHCVVLNWSMTNLYGLQPGETWFAASDLGWVVGHSYLVYAPLLHGNPTVLYEGKPVGTPDPSAFYRVLHDHDVHAMFVAPTALRAIRREDPHGKYHLPEYTMPNFKYMFVAGEHCDHETADWSKERFNVPILDNWWQTETGSAMSATCVGLGNVLDPPSGFAGQAVPGYNLQVVRDDHSKCQANELGQIVAKLPLSPCAFSTLWKDDGRFKSVYFTKYPGYYDTQDSGFYDEKNNFAVMGRTDDVINVAGHRLSTGALEEAVLEHNDIAECAVVAKPDELKGHIPFGFCVLNVDDHPKSKADLISEIVAEVRKHIGPVASFRDAIIVKRLPKTRSGKVARQTLAAMVAAKPYAIPVTIEDPTVYPDIEKALMEAGYSRIGQQKK